MEFILASIILYALNNLLWKKILLEENMWLIMSLRSLMTSALGLLLISLFYPTILDGLSLDSVAKVSFASFLGALGLVFMISALKVGSLRQLGLFNLAGVFFTVTYLLLFENFDLRYYAGGTSLILLGFILYLVQIKKDLSQDSSIKQLLLFALMTIFFSASGLLHWHNLKQSISPIFSLVNQEFTVFTVSIFGLMYRTTYSKKQIMISIMSIYRLIFIMAILIFLAVWFGFLGLKVTNPYLTSLLALSTPLLTIVFGVFFYKEKWSFSNLIALALIILGAFMLHFNLG